MLVMWPPCSSLLLSIFMRVSLYIFLLSATSRGGGMVVSFSSVFRIQALRPRTMHNMLYRALVKAALYLSMCVCLE